MPFKKAGRPLCKHIRKLTFEYLCGVPKSSIKLMYSHCVAEESQQSNNVPQRHRQLVNAKYMKKSHSSAKPWPYLFTRHWPPGSNQPVGRTGAQPTGFQAIGLWPKEGDNLGLIPAARTKCWVMWPTTDGLPRRAYLTHFHLGECQ